MFKYRPFSKEDTSIFPPDNVKLISTSSYESLTTIRTSSSTARSHSSTSFTSDTPNPSTSDSSHISSLQTHRSYSSPEGASPKNLRKPKKIVRGKSTIETALISCASTMMAPSRICCNNSPPMADEVLRAIRDELRLSLITKVGPTKGNNLFRRHVQQSHYLIINADEEADEAMGTRIRNLLENRPEPPIVTGRWNVSLGDSRLDAWQRLIQSATTILVIMSKALCRDRILNLCFPEALISDQAIVPLFLEYFTEDVAKELPAELRPIFHNFGKALYDERCDINSYINHLHEKFEYKRHYNKEVKSLEALLENINRDPQFVCQCGDC